MHTTRRRLGLAGLALAAGLITPAVGSAQQTLALYEDWNEAATIPSRRWGGSIDPVQEFHKLVQGHKLSLRLRAEGATTDDVGIGLLSNRLSFVAPALVEAVQAEFRVRDLAVSHCAANPNVSQTRAAVVTLNKFSDGTPGGPGNLTGDHLGRIQVSRRADSPDPAGAMRAQAFVLRCTSPSCATADVVTQLDFPDLVFVGDRFTLRIEWDAVNSQYLAAFNGGLSMPLAYAPGANAGPPRGAFADIRVQDRPASCTAGATITEALLEIGDVWTNPSALVP